ncbi:hypothetical protein JKF63_06836 [Porcisia hertigi]|uniref:Photolyase/cryptochrome alpha/beta domain-containing protein n=1 Tax=Porcisia hertigi TaxID=2761500 RepID=A0A836YGG6_9TRYP|nr:hypothetical protein JKF63_06836 [Porcisia hertigi]
MHRLPAPCRHYAATASVGLWKNRNGFACGGTLMCARRAFLTATRVRRISGGGGGDTHNNSSTGIVLDTAVYLDDPLMLQDDVENDLSDPSAAHRLLPGAPAAASPPPPPPSPPASPASPADITAEEWLEFQQCLGQAGELSSEVPCSAHGRAEPSSNSPARKVGQTAALAQDDLYSGDTLASQPLWCPPAPPLASCADAAELASDLAEEVAALHNDFGVSLTPDLEQGEQKMRAGSSRHCDGGVVFGDDAERDAQLLASLRGHHVRLQNTPDVEWPPLIIPDRSGQAVENTQPLVHSGTKGNETFASAPTTTDSTLAAVPQPTVHLLHRHNYLAVQDQLYLGACTALEAQLRPSGAMQTSPRCASTQPHGCCILVAFSPTDLRVHDNYLLALASVRARAAATETGGPVPVIGVCVLDYRTFAQPSVVGGFFRQSPQRAQFLLDTVAALRRELEDKLHVPLLVRCGRPEEHVPRLAVELGAIDVFMATQYAPHERRVQELMMRRLRAGTWISREETTNDTVATGAVEQGASVAPHEALRGPTAEEDDDPLIAVIEHDSWAAGGQHPYYPDRRPPSDCRTAAAPPVVHSVWQSTLVHLDDLPTPLAAMKEGERWYHDDVTVSTIRPTEPYDKATALLSELPLTWQTVALLPTESERNGRARTSVLRGALPRLEDLGYSAAAACGTDFAFQEVIATQSSSPDAGEKAALVRLQDWLAQGGMTSLLRYGRERRTNTKMYSQKLARVSPYIAVGALSPRKYYETLRQFAQENQRDAFVQQQFREGLLRLSRRDYWHWMGLRFGDRLFFSYGPHPEQTDDVPCWRHDVKVVQRWCDGLTGIPFADAAMRELVGTGFVAHEGRQALAWLLTRGYGQDWRLGAEWMERCSIDYDPFVCYGNYAYSCGLVQDDFGEPVRNVHYLAHQHDQTGIYVKKWLPQLSKIPPVYVHRPHVLTARMQAMHGVQLGHSYPYPLKLWQGAQRTLSAAELTAYYPRGIVRGPGYAEALRYSAAMLQPEEYNAAVSPAYLQRQQWAAMLPASAFAGLESTDEAVNQLAHVGVVTPRQFVGAAAAAPEPLSGGILA